MHIIGFVSQKQQMQYLILIYTKKVFWHLPDITFISFLRALHAIVFGCLWWTRRLKKKIPKFVAEISPDNPRPFWLRKFVIKYYFGKQKKLRMCGYWPPLWTFPCLCNFFYQLMCSLSMYKINTVIAEENVSCMHLLYMYISLSMLSPFCYQ